MNAFRDAITDTLSVYDLGKLDDPSLKTADVTDAVIAMPEMQAIKSALGTLAHYGGPGYLDYLELPVSVIEWVTA